MYANSNGQDLTTHLVGTMKMAIHCANKLGVKDPELVNVIALSAFFHDIGKCTRYFQNVTLRTNEDDLFDIIRAEYPNFSGKDDKDYYPRHNEVSWWYAARHARKGMFKNVGLQGIYWHHATFHYDPFERNTQSIADDFSVFDSGEFNNVDSSITNIINSVTFPFDINKYIEVECDDDPRAVPVLFVETKQVDEDISNAQRWLVRSCLVCADHIVSSLSPEELNDLVTNDCAEKYYLEDVGSPECAFERPAHYDDARFSLQKEIVSSCERTSVVKAPAGFGKSLIGVMWGANQNGQIYWVCPRNTVAEGVYQNVLEEIKTFGLNLSVELFLTSERKNCTHPEVPVCKSNIVITNIDNLLAPMVSHKHVARIFDVNATNVVFDEFHEFLNDEALFAAFVTYMRARNLLCQNTKTLLLSATPSVYHCFWDGVKDQVKVLPNEESHYPAQHSKPYTFSFGSEVVTTPEDSSLTMYSSIKNVQGNYHANNYTMIVHSHYSDDDRDSKMRDIMAVFGKGGTKNGKVISAPILQAAFDISFKTLYKTMESPEADIQTFGRVNRWGELDSARLVMLDLFSNRSEHAAINARYDLALSKLWAAFLTENATQALSLDRIYELYNKFNTLYKKELHRFISYRLVKSGEKLTTFFPKERRLQKGGEKIVTAKTLRNFGPSYFVVVRNKQTSTWENFTFNFPEYEVDDFINTDRNKLETSTIKTVWNNLNNVQDKDGEYVYNYGDVIKKFFGKKSSGKIFASHIKPYAKCSETPLPIWCKKYDSVLGLIDSNN